MPRTYSINQKGPENSLFATRLQFYAIELARNAEGCNDGTFDPSVAVLPKPVGISSEGAEFPAIREMEAMLDARDGGTATVDASAAAATINAIEPMPHMERDVLSQLSVKALKVMMEKYAVSSTGCVEKEDLVERLISAGSAVNSA